MSDALTTQIDALRRFWGKEFGQDFSRLHGEQRVLCPFHKEDTPSFSINLDSPAGHWRCFGCKAGGSVLTYIMQSRDVCFDEACTIWGQEGGLDASDMDALEDRVSGERKAHVPSLNPQLAAHYHGVLLTNRRELDYLTQERRIALSVLEALQVGYHPERDRITFPVYEDGKLVNIRCYGRNASGGDKTISWAKGYGAPRLYPLHAYDWEKVETVLVLEGETDCLVGISLLMRPDLGLAVLTSTGGAGTWLPEWSPLFTGKNVVICYDTDRAGVEGADKVASLLLPVASRVKVVYLPLTPPHKDLSDYLLKCGGTRESFWSLVAKTNSRVKPITAVYGEDLPEHLLPTRGFLGAAIRYGRGLTLTPQVWHMAGGLFALSAACGNSISIWTPSGEKCLNTWIALIGSSGGGKGSAMNAHRTYLLEALGLSAMLPSKGSTEGLMDGLLEHDGWGWVVWDEFSSYLDSCNKDYMASSKSDFMQLYDNTPVSSRTRGGGNRIIERPAPTIITGATTRSITAHSKDLRSGFFGRWLFFPHKGLDTETGFPENPLGDYDLRGKLVDFLRKLGNLDGRITFTRGAMNLYGASRTAWAERLRGLDSQEEEDVLKRLGSDYTFKLAALHSISEKLCIRPVPEESMRWAIELANWLADAMVRMLRTAIPTSKFDEKCKQVLLYVGRKGAEGVTRKELQRYMRVSARELDETVAFLLETDQVVEVREEAHGRGRPATRYYLRREASGN